MIKKLKLKKDLEKRERRNKWLLGIGLVVVLFGSFFGTIINSFGSSQETKGIEYNGYSFNQEGNYFTLNLGDSKFYFSNNPKTVDLLKKEINLSKVLSDYLKKPLYILSEDTSFFSEIYQNLNLYLSRIQFACKEGEKCSDETFPIKTCEDNFILIKEATENKIYEENNCVYIEGKKEDLLKLTDEFLFHLIGIKQ